MSDIPSWLHYGAFGVMVLVISAVGIALWRALVWAQTNIIKPAFDTHILMMQKIQDNLKAQEDHMRVEEVTQSKLAECFEQQCETGKTMARSLEMMSHSRFGWNLPPLPPLPPMP